MINYETQDVQDFLNKKLIDDYERNLKFDRMANDVEYLKSTGVIDDSIE